MSDYQRSGQDIFQERPSARAQQLFRPSASFMEDVEQSVPERFEKVVVAHSNRLAIKTANHALTYDALNKAANRVARVVLEKCGDSDTPVVVIFDHDVPILVAILAVLKAGKTCVALDPSYPEQRAAYIINDSQAKLILTNRKSFPLARQCSEPEHLILNIDEIDSNVSAENLGLSISPDALAFILYTSGSTGQPKGVIQNHRNVIHNALRYATGCRIGSEDRVTLLASLGTGQGTPTAFSALLSGAALYPLAIKQEGVAGLSTWLNTEEITVCISTPTLFRHFVGTLTGEENFPKLRMIRLGAEQIQKRDVDLYKKYFPSHCTLAIFLSATEAGNLCQYFVDKQTEITGDSVPVGRPVDGVDILLLDDSGKEVGPNEIGEIVVKSRFISPGYWRNPELTKAVFLPDGDKRIYRTGDLGRLLANGELEHLGRKDFQIKIRGYRVEIAEIESALLKRSQINEAVVVAMDTRAGDKRLVAYVVPAGQSPPSASELRSFLEVKLPDYMIPSAFVMLDALPLNSTGKVDRQALPVPDSSRPQLDVAYAAPRTSIEEKLVEIWEEILDLRPIGIHDNFFDIGGHSLAGASLISRLNRIFGLDLAVRVLFEAPTVAQLTGSIEVKQRTLSKSECKAPREKPSYLVELQSGRGKTRVFFFPGGGGGEPEFFIYAKLARHVGMDYSFYGLRAQGADGKSEPHRRVEEMVADYIQAIRTVQPHGPYFLVGECIGGIAAHAAARQLQAEGEKIALLALMDTQRPTKRMYLQYRIDQLFEPVRSNYFIQGIPYHWKNWCAIDYRQRIPYLFDKVGNAFGSRSHPLQPMESKRSRAQAVVEVNTDRRTVEHIDWIRARYRRVLRWHSPKPYEGRIHILVNEEYYNRDRTLGWGQLALKGLKIHKLPGNHDTYIREHVKATAQELRHCLDTARLRALKGMPARPVQLLPLI
jgi:amino acid adenylation domain-containing protein